MLRGRSNDKQHYRLRAGAAQRRFDPAQGRLTRRRRSLRPSTSSKITSPLLIIETGEITFCAVIPSPRWRARRPRVRYTVCRAFLTVQGHLRAFARERGRKPKHDRGWATVDRIERINDL
jgi:hypothetical protein